jgi:hypothetical protein
MDSLCNGLVLCVRENQKENTYWQSAWNHSVTMTMTPVSPKEKAAERKLVPPHH